MIDYPAVMFTLGYFFNIGANVQMIYTIQKDKHVEGYSFQTQILYAIAMVTKCFYFTLTSLSDHWIGWVELPLSVTSSLYLIYLFWKYRKLSFVQEKSYMFVIIGAPSCLVASIFLHPGFIEQGFDFASMMIACGVGTLSNPNRVIWRL